MKRKDWTVGQYGIRPVGKPDRCLYCDSKIGDQHKEDCVIRSKTVVINFNIEMVVDIPEYWTKENIEFRAECCISFFEAIYYPFIYFFPQSARCFITFLPFHEHLLNFLL